MWAPFKQFWNTLCSSAFGLSHCKQYIYVFDFNNSDPPGLIVTSPPLINGSHTSPQHLFCFLFHVSSMPRSLSDSIFKLSWSLWMCLSWTLQQIHLCELCDQKISGSLTLLWLLSTHGKNLDLGWMLGCDMITLNMQSINYSSRNTRRSLRRITLLMKCPYHYSGKIADPFLTYFTYVWGVSRIKAIFLYSADAQMYFQSAGFLSS